MKSIVVVHKFSLETDSLTERIKTLNSIVFEVTNIIDYFNILEVIVPNLVIIIIDSRLNKVTAHEIYCSLRKNSITKKIPMVFYNTIEHECLLHWRKKETKAKDTYLIKNFQAEQILQVVRKIISVQKSCVVPTKRVTTI
jgi:CheY-like chemotaxis protein